MSTSTPSPAGYAVRAVAHAHSIHSDGGATVLELREAVRRAGAQVLLLTDHDTLGAATAGEDGPGGGVLVVVGHEVSPKAGHLLVFGTETVIDHDGRDERAVLDAVAAAGGVAYPAHPFSRGSAMSRTIAPPHAWKTFDHPAVRGIEVWSLQTDTAESWRTPLAAARDLRDPRQAALAGPDAERLRRWDDLSRTLGRPLGGLGGQDAHAAGVRVRGRLLTPQPHARWLRLVQTVLWLREPLGGDAASDRAAVLEALRAGRTAVALPALGEPTAVAVWWRAPDGQILPPGAEGPAAGTVLHVEAPSGTTVVRLHDGLPIGEPGSVHDSGWPAEGPGLHRVELLREDADGRRRRWVLPAGVWLR